MKDELAVAVVGARFGVRGEVRLRSLSDETDHLLNLRGVSLRKNGVVKQATIESARKHTGGVVVRFAGVETPEDARLLTGFEVWVDRSFASPLDEDEYYTADLVGLSLYYHEHVIGTIASVWNSGAHDILEIRKTDDSRVLLPFLSRYVGDVDIESGRVELLVDWIVE